ncbi:MAG: cell division protein FtsA [Verrucomicrobiota bacterium]
MAKSSIHVGLEIGTHKIAVVVGEVRPDGAIKILGVGHAPSRGVRKGEIVDFKVAKTCLNDALLRAEDLSDVIIRSVFLSVTGGHVQSFTNRGCITIPEDQNEITEGDLEEVKNISREVDLPESHIILHSVVRYYYLDGQDRVLDPVGMMAQRLEADYHIIHGIRTRLSNSIRCVREIPLEVEDVVFAPIASAQVVLTKQAKQDGALVFDIGAGATDYVLYEDGVMAASGCVPLGGDHITNDIAVVLRIPQSVAEKLKVEEGSALPGRAEASENVYLEDDMQFVGREIERELLDSIIQSRIHEIFDLIKKRLQPTGYLDRLSSGIFLTGGTSQLHGIDQAVANLFQMPVHRPSASSAISGITATFENPQYATPIGLIRYAQILDEERSSKSRLARLGRKLKSLLSSSKP